MALQTQGLNEDAARFAYRAHVLQRKVLWFQMIQPQTSLCQRIRKLSAWFFSHLLNLVAGYGYRPERSFLAYLLVIFGFMGFYLLTSHFTTPHLRWDEALVLSVSSFHGRGFFPQTITLGDPYARLAVTEAVLGLFIEISFIATFTQWFFGKRVESLASHVNGAFSLAQVLPFEWFAECELMRLSHSEHAFVATSVICHNAQRRKAKLVDGDTKKI